MIELISLYLGFNLLITLFFFTTQKEEFESFWIICAHFIVFITLAIPLVLLAILDDDN